MSLPPLDDLLVVAGCARRLDRCLRRHRVARLAGLPLKAEDKLALPKMLKNCEPGFVRADVKFLPRMPDETEHRYLFATIDRTRRWAHFDIRPDKTAETAVGFLGRLRETRS